MPVRSFTLNGAAQGGAPGTRGRAPRSAHVLRVDTREAGAWRTPAGSRSPTTVNAVAPPRSWPYRHAPARAFPAFALPVARAMRNSRPGSRSGLQAGRESHSNAYPEGELGEADGIVRGLRVAVASGRRKGECAGCAPGPLRGPDGRIRQAFHWVVSGPALRRPGRRTPRIAGPGHRRSGACCRRRTVVVGRQHVRAPSRVAPGRAALRVQLQEVPFAPSSDAAGEPDVSAPWPAHRRANGPAVTPRPGTVRPVGGKAPGPPRRATPGTGRADATVRCR